MILKQMPEDPPPPSPFTVPTPPPVWFDTIIHEIEIVYPLQGVYDFIVPLFVIYEEKKTCTEV